jgi:hypothetical protein
MILSDDLEKQLFRNECSGGFPRRRDVETAYRAGVSVWKDRCEVAVENGKIVIRQAAIDGPEPPPGHVYFIKCEGFVKIGYSGSFAARIDAIQTSNPFEVTLLHTVPGDLALENSFHERFRAHHHRLEWFRFEGELKEWLEAQAK